MAPFCWSNPFRKMALEGEKTSAFSNNRSFSAQAASEDNRPRLIALPSGGPGARNVLCLGVGALAATLLAPRPRKGYIPETDFPHAPRLLMACWRGKLREGANDG